MSQRHLVDQVQARYPQAINRSVTQEDDPLARREGETVSAVELRAGAAAYLPLASFANANCCKKEPIPCSVFWACSTTCQLTCAS